jgi:hypothetical protein
MITQSTSGQVRRADRNRQEPTAELGRVEAGGAKGRAWRRRELEGGGGRSYGQNLEVQGEPRTRRSAELEGRLEGGAGGQSRRAEMESRSGGENRRAEMEGRDGRQRR